jgi:hypothetical protein
MDVDQIYEEHVRSLSPADQLRLAARIVAKAAVSADTSSVPPPPPSLLARPDPADTTGWADWLESTRISAGERLAATQREMQARGILDEECRLTEGELPEDMRPGSTTSVATG